MYPTLLNLLRPSSVPGSATILGWHAEGPFLNVAKRGAHAPPFLLPAPEGTKTFEDIYGEQNLSDNEDWLMAGDGQTAGVRMITAAPEVDGVMNAIGELSKRGVVFSIGHRYFTLPFTHVTLPHPKDSVARSDIATLAVRHGASIITHLFNAMPQLHHRDPSIIGLLGASPHLSSPLSPIPPVPPRKSTAELVPASTTLPVIETNIPQSEAFDNSATPPLSPDYTTSPVSATPDTPAVAGIATTLSGASKKLTRSELHLDKGQIADMAFVRPFYGMIVDGIHSHPNSVRVSYPA